MTTALKMGLVSLFDATFRWCSRLPAAIPVVFGICVDFDTNPPTALFYPSILPSSHHVSGPLVGDCAHLNGSAPTVNGSAPLTDTQRLQEIIVKKLASANEATWLLFGSVAEQMGNLEHALSAYENVLRHNPNSLAGLTKVAGIARIKENYGKAIEYFQCVLNVQEDNGEFGVLLAYAAYQQALYLLPNPKVWNWHPV
ncbi:hypothetical protein DL96DRAFT_1566181 [Flagelloscypha sp. PMI_526]|nr:hypothetical protein DL96DRAFT_1566181 [Flagelloscypha sp. PMI_526]